MKVGLYARNSKPPRGWKASHPGEEPSGSWKVQLESLRGWSSKEGHEVAMEEHDMRSGKDANRPAWERILHAARGHHVHIVAVTKVDRVMRSMIHFYDVVREFSDLGVDLVFIDQGVRISKRDPMSKFLIGNLALIAEFERDLIRERIGAVMRMGNDGRLYGPRSQRPVGRPSEYGPDHRFRIRAGRKTHDKARCRACRPPGDKGGHGPSEGGRP